MCDLIPRSLITLNESGLISKSVTLSVIAFESYMKYDKRFRPVVITADTVCACALCEVHINAATVHVKAIKCTSVKMAILAGY